MYPRVLALAALVAVASAAVIGIDFGSEFVKVASVQPGKTFHIVLDEQSQRKVPHVVTFDDNQRHFGNGATSLAVRKPKDTYVYAQTLLGRDITSPQAKLFSRYYYPHELVEVPERGGAVGFHHASGTGLFKEDTVFSPEEIVAMTLQHIKHIAEEDSGTPVKDCVITVPEFFTQKERQAMLDAAELAGLNVLSLINENSAALIQYGIDRKYSVNETHRVIIYNMGSSSTKVTLATLSGYVEPRKNKTVGQFEVNAVAWDETLGGQAFEVLLMDWMAGEVNKQLAAKGDKTDVRTNTRVMAKIRAQAVKTKTVLSANKETPVVLSSLLNDMDFKMFITRTEFEEYAKDLLARSTVPLEKVLRDAKLKPEEVDAIVLIGGSSRIPGVQQAIRGVMQRDELGFTLNADEASAMGAVFRAANLSTAFKLRRFGMVDINPFSVGVRFTDLPKDGAAVPAAEEEAPAAALESSGEGEEAESPQDGKPFSKRAALFRRYNRLSKRKTVTFSHTSDLQCSVHHDAPAQLPAGVSQNIGRINITGLDALARNTDKQELLATQKPKVSLSFILDASGLVDLVKAEATLEEMVKVPVAKPKAEKKDEATAAAPAAGEGEGEAEAGAGAEASTEGEGEVAAAAAGEGEAEGEGAAAATGEGEAEAEVVEYKMQKKTHRFPLKLSRNGGSFAVQPLSRDVMRETKAKLTRLTRQDELRKEIAQSKNSVEAFIYNTRNTINENDEVAVVSTEGQRQEVLDALEKAEEWLYEQGEDEPGPFKSKLAELTALYQPIAHRLSERVERPQAVNASRTVLSVTRSLLKQWEVEKPWLNPNDTAELAAMVDEAEAWLDEKEAAQDKLQPHEDPAFSSDEVMERVRPIAKLSQAMMKRQIGRAHV